MRKSIFTLLSVSALSFLNAQSISSSDFGMPGDGVIQSKDDNLLNNNPNLGSAAAAQTWNFQNFDEISLDSISFVNPSATPYALDFAGSNLALATNKIAEQLSLPGTVASQDGPGFLFLNNSSTKIEIVGIGGNLKINGSNMPIKGTLQDPMTILEFPSTLGSTFTDSYGFDIKIESSAFTGGFNIDSVRVKRLGTQVALVDAAGTLNLPYGGTFPSIRQFVTEIYIDSIWVHAVAAIPQAGITGPGWAMPDQNFAMLVGLQDFHYTDTIKNYKWFGPSGKYTLAQINVNKLNLAPYKSSYRKAPFVGIDDILSDKDIQSYPNPANEKLVIINNKNVNYDLVIHDLTGREVYKTKLDAVKNEINTAAFSQGLYVYSIKNNDKVLKTKKFSVLR